VRLINLNLVPFNLKKVQHIVLEFGWTVITDANGDGWIDESHFDRLQIAVETWREHPMWGISRVCREATKALLQGISDEFKHTFKEQLALEAKQEFALRKQQAIKKLAEFDKKKKKLKPDPNVPVPPEPIPEDQIGALLDELSKEHPLVEEAPVVVPVSQQKIDLDKAFEDLMRDEDQGSTT
jgi:hypothetical protein